MEGFWFWDNYHQDKGMDAAWRIVTNYIARGRMDVGVTCAGNHTHLFSKTEIDRSTLTKKLLAEKWGISTRTFLMADNPGISCSLITPYVRAGIRYGSQCHRGIARVDGYIADVIKSVNYIVS